jgi:flavin-binding protein dodecin
VRDLRVAEITKLDMVVENNSIALYRARVSLSFKYEASAKPKSKKKGK